MLESIFFGKNDMKACVTKEFVFLGI